MFIDDKNGVYLKRLASGVIVLADKDGAMLGGQSKVKVENDIDCATTATVTFQVCGWADDEK